MNNKRKGILYGALLGDSFALASHWIYDTEVIQEHFSQVDSLEKPVILDYHKDKDSGDFTHYGDQAGHLAHFIKARQGFDVEAYKAEWITFVEQEENMYMDHATKDSLERFKDKDNIRGSHSNDLGGIVSNCAFYQLDEIDYDQTVSRIRMTHDNEDVVSIWQFVYHVIKHVLDGAKPSDTIEDLIKASDSQVIKKSYEKAISQLKNVPVHAITKIGQSCALDYGFPSSLYLILKYQDNYEAAMKANILAGGDSASRGMVVGMVLGAYHGYDALPNKWLDTLNFEL